MRGALAAPAAVPFPKRRVYLAGRQGFQKERRAAHATPGTPSPTPPAAFPTGPLYPPYPPGAGDHPLAPR